MARKILVSGLALAPLAAILRWGVDAGDVTVFCASAIALVPLAWLIGEATEQAAEHTGPGVGGFLNASFGNAPELFMALFATGEEDLDRPSLRTHLGLVMSGALLFLIPSVAGWHGNPDRHTLAVATIPVAGLLLLFYLWQTS